MFSWCGLPCPHKVKTLRLNFGTYHHRCEAYQIYSNGDPRLTFICKHLFHDILNGMANNVDPDQTAPADPDLTAPAVRSS